MTDMTCRHAAGVIAAVFSFACHAAADPPHQPELLLNQADLDALKTKVDGPFAQQWAHWLDEADKLVAEPVELPPRRGELEPQLCLPGAWGKADAGEKDRAVAVGAHLPGRQSRPARGPGAGHHRF